MHYALRHVTFSCLLSLLALGCGSTVPATAKVSGVLTYNGSPVDGATVIFDPVAGGRPATAITDPQGRYRLTTFAEFDGAVPGDYTVTAQKIKIEGGPELSDEQRYELMNKVSRFRGPVSKNLLPERYANGGTSDLTATVRAGDNEIPLQLKD